MGNALRPIFRLVIRTTRSQYTIADTTVNVGSAYLARGRQFKRTCAPAGTACIHCSLRKPDAS